MDILSAAVLLFLIMDPLGNVPLFLAVLKGVKPERRLKLLARELLIALVALVIFLGIGKPLMGLLGLRQESVAVGGGIVLFLIGVKMVFPSRDGIFGELPKGEPFIVPLAIPCVAGPSVMAALLLLSNKEPERWMDWLFALLIAWFATAVILLSSTRLQKWLGDSVIHALEKLMGMLLVAVSVQMILDAVKTFLNG
jgi:multiple antibiotic resistance protein